MKHMEHQGVQTPKLCHSLLLALRCSTASMVIVDDAQVLHPNGLEFGITCSTKGEPCLPVWQACSPNQTECRPSNFVHLVWLIGHSLQTKICSLRSFSFSMFQLARKLGVSACYFTQGTQNAHGSDHEFSPPVLWQCVLQSPQAGNQRTCTKTRIYCNTEGVRLAALMHQWGIPLYKTCHNLICIYIHTLYNIIYNYI